MDTVSKARYISYISDSYVWCWKLRVMLYSISLTFIDVLDQCCQRWPGRTAIQDFTFDRVMNDGWAITDADCVLTSTFSECHGPNLAQHVGSNRDPRRRRISILNNTWSQRHINRHTRFQQQQKMGTQDLNSGLCECKVKQNTVANVLITKQKRNSIEFELYE